MTRKIATLIVTAAFMVPMFAMPALAHNECNTKGNGVTRYEHNHGQSAKQPHPLCLPEKVSENSAHGDIH
jgi:hypothetical protein